MDMAAKLSSRGEMDMAAKLSSRLKLTVELEDEGAAAFAVAAVVGCSEVLTGERRDGGGETARDAKAADRRAILSEALTVGSGATAGAAGVSRFRMRRDRRGCGGCGRGLGATGASSSRWVLTGREQEDCGGAAGGVPGTGAVSCVSFRGRVLARRGGGRSWRVGADGRWRRPQAHAAVAMQR